MCSQTDSEEGIAVVVGLGNPGERYESTRHNVGFQVLDLLARESDIEWRAGRFRAVWGVGDIEGRSIVLFKPQTFMNLSGEAVLEMLRHFGFSFKQVLVVHDDLDLPPGRIRLAGRGGAGGHRGVSSIIHHLEQRDFPRLKLGIGRPLYGEPIESFVLQPPYPEDQHVFQGMVRLSAEAVRAVLRSGLIAAMNHYNRREPTSDGASSSEGSHSL